MAACYIGFFALFLNLVLVQVEPVALLPTTTNISQMSLKNLEVRLPALYVFGSSYIDAGNNNYLNTRVKLNYPPYGVDFQGGIATGRATNGRTVVDFIAHMTGLPFPPPVLGLHAARKKIPHTGVNYGSGSSGILPMPPHVKSIFLDVLSLDEQIEYFRKTTENLKDQFESLQNFATHMSKPLVFIQTGSNDLGIYWQLEYSKDYKKFENYAIFLSRKLYRGLEAIYKLGARNFLVNNVYPLGCVPANLQYKPPNSSCAEEINRRAAFFNGLLPKILTDLETSLKGSTFALYDLYGLFEVVYAQPATYGFTNVNSSCCIDVARNQTRECAKGSIPCNDRRSHVFFDPFHPTEHIHYLWAKRVLFDNSNLFELIMS